MAEPKALYRDLNALRRTPIPRDWFTWGDPPVKYAIRSVADMTYAEIAQVFAEPKPATSIREDFAELRARLKIVVPDLPDEALEPLTYAETSDLFLAALTPAPKEGQSADPLEAAGTDATGAPSTN